jgi:polar amino acid transport system substrate-binding protein
VAKDRPALLAAMNQALAACMRDGTFTRLFVRWNPPSVPIPARLYADYPGMPHPAAP